MPNDETGGLLPLVDDAARLRDILAEWVAARIHNSAVAQSTEAYNHFIQTALPDLIQRLVT